VKSKELYELLVEENADMLLVFLQSAVRDRNTVDDLFQETLLVAWKNLGRFDRSRSFGRWLRGIARNLVLVHRRKSMRGHILCDEEVLEIVDDRCEALQRHRFDTLDEKLAALRDCVGGLPDKYREAVHARYNEGVRGRELATRLETSIENAKKRLQRGRQKLLECLERKHVLDDEAGVEPLRFEEAG